MQYEVVKQFISQNRSGNILNPIGCVVHETADPGATAEAEYSYFNSGYRAASAHAFVDWTSIVQTVPWTEESWHAGPTANSNYIGIELCRPASYDEAAFKEVWNRGGWLFAWIFKNVLGISKITKDNLMSHEEVSNKWHETDHEDPSSYFKSYGKTVDDFRNSVQEEINSMAGDKSGNNQQELHWAKKYFDYLVAQGIELTEERFDENVTRGEMFKLMALLKGYKE